MKKLLSIVLLLTVTLFSGAFAIKRYPTKKRPMKKQCCFPNKFPGAGSTLLGQTVDCLGVSSDNTSFLIVTTQNYQRVKECPIFEYNGLDPVTNKPFEQGSCAGITQTLEGVTIFGGTDTPPEESQVVPQGDLLNFPCAVAGVCPVYNLPNSSNVQLTAEALARIFSGRLENTSWGAVAALGGVSGINLLDEQEPVRVVVRSDCSGSTGFFTQYLNTSTQYPGLGAWTIGGSGFGNGPFTEEDWRGAYNLGLSNKFIPYTFVKGSDGVIKEVNSRVGSIGYVGFNNFLVVGAPNTNVAEVEDNNGAFVAPNATTIGLAISDLVNVPSNLLINTIQSTVEGAYPIASPTNIVVRFCQLSKCQVIELRKFLYYIATVGQLSAVPLGLAPLSEPIIKQYLKNLDLLKSFENCVNKKVCDCCVKTKKVKKTKARRRKKRSSR